MAVFVVQGLGLVLLEGAQDALRGIVGVLPGSACDGHGFCGFALKGGDTGLEAVVAREGRGQIGAQTRRLGLLGGRAGGGGGQDGVEGIGEAQDEVGRGRGGGGGGLLEVDVDPALGEGLVEPGEGGGEGCGRGEMGGAKGSRSEVLQKGLVIHDTYD